MPRPRRGDGVLSSRQRLAAVDALERIEEQLGECAGWLDDADEVRVAAMLMSAQRNLLAACYLIAPPAVADLQDVIEQRQMPVNGSHRA